MSQAFTILPYNIDISTCGCDMPHELHNILDNYTSLVLAKMHPAQWVTCNAAITDMAHPPSLVEGGDLDRLGQLSSSLLQISA